MSKVLVADSNLSSIAAAIRQKNGESTRYRPGQMAQAILDIEGGGYPEPTGTVNITENGTHNVKNYASAEVSVQPVLEPLSVTENGTYTPGTGVDGYNQVDVNVTPVLQSKTVTENGTVTPDSGYDGLSSVVVNVPIGGDALPSEYKKVQYLVTGGSCTYVSIPFLQKNGDRLLTKARADWTQSSVVALGGLKTSFGQSSGYRANWHVVSSRRQLWADGGCVETLTSDPTVTARNNTAVSYGDTLAPNDFAEVDITLDSTTASVMQIFHGAYSSSQYCKNTELYDLYVIRADGNTAIHLVPCVRISDSVCGFYDLRASVFLVATAGSFTAGSDV